MYDIIDAVEPYMPADKPRYLMGVGTPSNIIEGVARGVDFFDCVMPARNARHAKLFTWSGALNIRNEKYKLDERPHRPGLRLPGVPLLLPGLSAPPLCSGGDAGPCVWRCFTTSIFYNKAGRTYPPGAGRGPIRGIPGGVFREIGRDGCEVSVMRRKGLVKICFSLYNVLLVTF